MKLAILGLKGHHKDVLKGAKALGHVEVVAVSDDLPENVHKFQKGDPWAAGADVYTDWKALLEHAVFDYCCVGGENFERDEQLVRLLERNVHVIAEKPLATTHAKLDRIRTALEKSKSRLTMLLTMRHDPSYVALRELVASGVVGEVCQASSQKSYQIHTRPEWFKHRDRLGGMIPFIGVHAIDLIYWCSGLDFTHVAAFHNNLGLPQAKETETAASVLLRMTNGASATARLDFLRPMGAASHGDDRLRIAGSKGTVEIGVSERNVLVLEGTKKPRLAPPKPDVNFFVDFVDAVEKNRPARVPAEDAFRITEIVLHARDAADNSTMIQLPPKRRVAGGL